MAGVILKLNTSWKAALYVSKNRSLIDRWANRQFNFRCLFLPGIGKLYRDPGNRIPIAQALAG